MSLQKDVQSKNFIDGYIPQAANSLLVISQRQQEWSVMGVSIVPQI
jgi:hypothetical protein